MADPKLNTDRALGDIEHSGTLTHSGHEEGIETMTRIIVGGVAGAVVYFVWGMLAWMVLPLHTASMHGLDAESQITEALTSEKLQTGVYVAPWTTDEADWQDPESQFMQRHTAGPIYSIYYRREGSAPMNAGVLAGGFVIDLLAALLAASLLSCMGSCGGKYLCRVGFVAGLGVFVALVGHASYWNWMHFPWDYTVAFMVDVGVGWTLAGLAIAALVRPAVRSTAKAEVASSTATARPAAAAEPSPAKTRPAETRSDALNLLATLQREARFVDIVKEPLSEYTDAQVGAAARDVLRDCAAVLDRFFQLAPVVEDAEGAQVELTAGFDSARYRVAGKAQGELPWTGKLTHHGWQAGKCELPQWTGSRDAAMVVAPAEVEVK